MNASVPQGVFSEPLYIVDGLCGISVADKLGVEIPRMVWRLQRKPEVIHGENVFKKLGFLEVTDSSGLPRGIQ